MHFNVTPSGDRDRVVTYVCMAPAELLNEQDRATKTRLFKEGKSTTHNPYENIFVRQDDLETFPVQDRVKPNDLVLKLAGVEAYA